MRQRDSPETKLLGCVNDSGDVVTQTADRDGIQNVAVNQYGGDAVDLDDASVAAVANEAGVSREAVIACLESMVGTANDDTAEIPVARPKVLLIMTRTVLLMGPTTLR